MLMLCRTSRKIQDFVHPACIRDTHYSALEENNWRQRTSVQATGSFRSSVEEFESVEDVHTYVMGRRGSEVEWGGETLRCYVSVNVVSTRLD